MKSCDLISPLARLQRAAARLNQQWSKTQEHWTDKNRKDFEEAHVQPVAPLVQMTSAAVQKLSELLQQAERDCGDEAASDYF